MKEIEEMYACSGGEVSEFQGKLSNVKYFGFQAIFAVLIVRIAVLAVQYNC